MKMIKKITTNLLLFASISFLLTSCEGNTIRRWTVQNNSSTSIDVQGVLVIDNSTLIKKISPGSAEIIAITEQRGGSSTIQTPEEAFQSLGITNAANDSLKKDYKLQTNWETSAKQVKKRPSHYEHTYILTITDQDF